MLQRMRNVSVAMGFSTPEGWKVPRGRQPYIVRTVDQEGNQRRLVVSIEPENPEQIRDQVFSAAPETTDYTFRAVDRAYVHGIGRVLAQRAFTFRTIGMALAIQQETSSTRGIYGN